MLNSRMTLPKFAATLLLDAVTDIRGHPPLHMMQYLRNHILLFLVGASVTKSSSPSLSGNLDQIPLTQNKHNGGLVANDIGLDIEMIEDCSVYRAGRYDMAKGRQPVSFSTGTARNMDWESPSVNPMNGTAGEQWEFDGVSYDGSQAFIFGVYRDPNYSFLGTGNLRVHAEFSRENGSRYSIIDYAEDSTVISCPGRWTRGIWRGKEFEYTFEVAADLSRVKVSIDNPEAKLTINMKSMAPPRYPNNEIWSPKSTPPPSGASTVPHFYWVEPVPVATVEVSGIIEEHGVVNWSGMGGHERLWGAFNWPTCLSGLTAVRLLTGPYALSFIQFGSGRQRGLEAPSLILAKNGEKIFASQVVTFEGSVEDDSVDHVLVKKVYNGDGATTKHLNDKVTGVELLLVSPAEGKTWKFIVTHKNVLFEYVLTEGLGGTGYSGIATGGLLGDNEDWEGSAFTEIMKFPEDWWLLSKNFVN